MNPDINAVIAHAMTPQGRTFGAWIYDLGSLEAAQALLDAAGITHDGTSRHGRGNGGDPEGFPGIDQHHHHGRRRADLLGHGSGWIPASGRSAGRLTPPALPHTTAAASLEAPRPPSCAARSAGSVPITAKVQRKGLPQPYSFADHYRGDEHKRFSGRMSPTARCAGRSGE